MEVTASRAALEAAGIYEQYYDASLASYTGPDKVKVSLRRFKTLLAGGLQQFQRQPVAGLYLHGPHNTGKSMFAAILAKYSLLQKHMTTEVVPAHTLIERDKAHDIEAVSAKDFLVIDDLDKAEINSYTRSLIEELVTYRAKRRMPTVLVGDARVGKELAEKIGGKAASVVECEYAHLAMPVVEEWQHKQSEQVLLSLLNGKDLPRGT